MSAPKKYDKYALIIDDDPDFLKILAKILEELNVGVISATNAAEARLRMRFQRFDLIITDLVMPKENGVQFLVSLHNGAEGGRQHEIPPLAVITGCTLNDTLKTRLTKFLRVELILEKPLNAELLRKFVVKRLNMQKKEHAYDVTTINKFLGATLEIISMNTRSRPEPCKAFARLDGLALGEFTGVIELASKTRRGFVALSFARACCEAMARRILFDENVQATDVMLRDVAGEMCNQVAGHTQAQFNREGTRFEISTPTIVSGTKYRIDHRMQAPCIVIPFTWEGQKFFTQFVMTHVDVSDEEAAKETAEPVRSSEERLETVKRGDVEFFQ